MLLSLLACSDPADDASAVEDASNEDGAWTLLVYMDGDNSLEGYVAHDLDELEAGVAAAGRDDVRVLVQADRIDGWADDDGDWTGTRRYRIGAERVPGEVDSPWEDAGELDMGDPGTLADFLAWGTAEAPAERVALVLWNHGYAWSMTTPPPPSIAGDDTSGTELSIAEGDLRAGLEAHVAAHGPLDLVAFDACYMSSWEVAHSLRDQAEVLVGSEAWVGGEGLRYVPMLATLGAAPDTSASTIGDQMARDAVLAGEMTFSAVDLSAMDTLASAVDAFARVSTPAQLRAWQRFGRTVEPAWAAAFLDLGALAMMASRQGVAEATDLQAATDAAVLGAYGDDAHAWSSGLTIFGATSVPDYLSLYATGAGATWAEATAWDELLVQTATPP